jgi:hypothetical protein
MLYFAIRIYTSGEMSASGRSRISDCFLLFEWRVCCVGYIECRTFTNADRRNSYYYSLRSDNTNRRTRKVRASLPLGQTNNRAYNEGRINNPTRTHTHTHTQQ